MRAVKRHDSIRTLVLSTVRTKGEVERCRRKSGGPEGLKNGK
jgi:hypothetical protein